MEAIRTVIAASRRKFGFGWDLCFRRKFSAGGGGGNGGDSGRTSITEISSIPEDLYPDILLRLPVKSLLRCKSVCKDWYDLISTSQFVELHHALAVQRNNPKLVLSSKYHNLVLSVDYDSLPSPSSVSEIHDYVIQRDCLFKSQFCVGFLGFCNGLVWLFNDGGDRNIFCLWNPATREYKELSESPVGFNRGNVCIHGLGYDQKNGDYKLAIGVKDPASKFTTVVQFYSLAPNSWKTEKSIPYWFCHLELSGVLVHGNLHWIALGRNGIFLLSLDISDENFQEMQLPTEILELNDKDLRLGITRGCLGVLQGCLCLFFGSHVNGVQSHFEVWEMLDYEIHESWSKRYVIANESIVNDQRFFKLPWSSNYQRFFKLLWSFQKDEILLLGCDFLVFYDSKHGSSRVQKLLNVPFWKAETYFESLVSLNSGTYVVGERKSPTGKTIAILRKLDEVNAYYLAIIAVVILVYIYEALFR